ncbi:MAG: DUF6320 domain-containing protein [Bacilli bacterium]
MEYCDRCKININTKTNICPLCHNRIKIDKDAKITYPLYEPLKDKYTKTAIIISSIAPFLIVLALVLNLFVIKSSYWSVIAIAGIIYFWLLGLLTFNKRINMPVKLIAHAITISLILLIINMFASNELVIKNITWAISYAIPLLIFTFIAFINFIMFNTKQKLRDFLLYQLVLCLLGFIPLVILIWGIAKPLYPSILTAFYSYSTILYLIVFSKSIIKEEFKKRFHI